MIIYFVVDGVILNDVVMSGSIDIDVNLVKLRINVFRVIIKIG